MNPLRDDTDAESNDNSTFITRANIQQDGLVAMMKIVEHKGDISRVAISKSTDFFVLSSEDSTASVWDTKTGKLKFLLKGHTDDIRSVRISPDDSFIITTSNDTNAIRWDSKSGKKLKTYGIGTQHLFPLSPSLSLSLYLSIYLSLSLCLFFLFILYHFS